jgi:hypothetical protein
MHAFNRRRKAEGPPHADPVHLLAARALGRGGPGGPPPGAPLTGAPNAFARACASDEALIRRLAPVADLATGGGGGQGRNGGAVHSVAWSPGGSLLAASGDDHRVRVWDIDGGSPRAACMDVVR